MDQNQKIADRFGTARGKVNETNIIKRFRILEFIEVYCKVEIEQLNLGPTMKTAGCSIVSLEAKSAKSLFAQLPKLIWYSHRSIGFSILNPPM